MTNQPEPQEIKFGNINPGAVCWVVLRLEKPPEQLDDLTLAHMSIQVGGVLRMIEHERDRRIDKAFADT